MADPLMELNPLTRKHRIVLRGGDPVADPSPDYQILSVLAEDPWLGEETPRLGNLIAEFSEQTTVTASALKAAAERRGRLLLETSPQVLTEFEVTSVTQPLEGVLLFTAVYQVPGDPERQNLLMELGT